MRRQRGSILLYGILALAIIGSLGGIGYSVRKAGYDAAMLECQQAAAAQREREAQQAAKAAVKLEVSNAKAKVVYRTITRDVDKVVTRVEYRNICLPDDGLRHARRAIEGTLTPAAEPDKPVPDAARTRGRD